MPTVVKLRVRGVKFSACLWGYVLVIRGFFLTTDMTDFKEQRICIKFRFNLKKTAAEIHRMLQEAFGDNAVTHSHLRRSRDAWNHGKPAGIAVYMPKGTTLKETVETRSYDKKLFFMVKFPEFLGSPRYNWQHLKITRYRLHFMVTIIY
jgi:hypothetical protein